MEKAHRFAKCRCFWHDDLSFRVMDAEGAARRVHMAAPYAKLAKRIAEMPIRSASTSGAKRASLELLL